MTAHSQCRRVLGAALTALSMGCPSTSDAPSRDVTSLPETTIIAADGATETEVAAREVIADEVDAVAPEVASVVDASDAADVPWSASTIAIVDGRWSFVGLPGVSADGMHLALIDRSEGRIAIDVTRLDGVVLVDKVLREAREAALDPKTLQRRFKARIAQAHKVLAKAGVHALTATTFEARADDYVVKVPGAKDVIVSKGALDRPCGRATGIDAAFYDREHGLVVLSVVHDGDCASEKARLDWHVVTFESAAGAVLP